MNRARPRRITFLVYDGIQSLDLTGPLEVFSIANWVQAQNDASSAPPYSLEVVAERAGAIRASSGLQIVVDRELSRVTEKIDTLIVAGGEVYESLSNPRLLGWVKRTAPRVRRLASVCSGAFLLAQAGLLDGRRATTHWSAVNLLAGYSQVEVEPDAIYIRDGNVYTSAGVTAGIDLALALVEEDLGHKVALAIARRLVVFLKRPGGQSQFSGHLVAQSQPSGRMKDLAEWVTDNLTADLSIEGLAHKAAMSPRNFARRFLSELGLTPAKFVEKIRLDHARRLLEDSRNGLEEIAGQCGFASGEQMRRTFLRHLHIVPADYRRRFQLRPAAAIAPSTLSPSAISKGDHHGRSSDKETRRSPVSGLRAARRVRAA